MPETTTRNSLSHEPRLQALQLTVRTAFKEPRRISILSQPAHISNTSSTTPESNGIRKATYDSLRLKHLKNQFTTISKRLDRLAQLQCEVHLEITELSEKMVTIAEHLDELPVHKANSSTGEPNELNKLRVSGDHEQ